MPPRTRELAAPRDHVDAVVGELDEPGRDVAEIVPAGADDELDRRDIGEPGRERLDGAAHRRGDDERRRAVPAGDAPEDLEARADDLGARAQPLVRQRLPRREVQHLGTGQQRAERGTERLGAATGRRDQQHHRRLARGAAALDQGGEQRSVEALDEREVRIDGCRGHGIPERLSLLEGAHDPGNCHRTSLRRRTDTGLRGPTRHRVRRIGGRARRAEPRHPLSGVSRRDPIRARGSHVTVLLGSIA